MEVTSVSPSATLPTEGDNLCEIDVSNVAIHSVTLLICLCGLAGNGAVLWLFRNNYRYIEIFRLAFADFPFLLFAVPSVLLFLVEDLSCTPILPVVYLSFLFQLSVFSCYWAVLFAFLVSPRHYMWKLYKRYCHREPPRWLERSVNIFRIWAFFAFFAVIPTVTLQCPSHYQEYCRAPLISIHAVILLLFVVPMVISRTINLIKTRRGSEEQQRKWLDIVTFLVVLLNFLLSIFNFLQQLGYILVSSQVVFLLYCAYSSIKPFIHFLVGRCWRRCSVGSRLSQQRVSKWLEEDRFFMESLRFSLQRILDGLQENHISTDSHRLSLKKTRDGLKRKPFSVEPLQLPLQSVLEEPEQNTAHRNDAAKDTGH